MIGSRTAPLRMGTIAVVESVGAAWGRIGMRGLLRWIIPADALLPLSIGLWIGSVGVVRIQAINDFGLVPALPPTFFVSLALLTVSFVVVLTRTAPSTWRLATHVVALVVMLQGLLPLVLQLPQYNYVFKHFGVVDYIALHGSVNDRIDIYQNWPGFFALAAWFDRLAGAPSPIAYAAWSPVYFNLLALFAINASLRALLVPARVRWLSLFIVVVGNWVGQDYFAPQALAFVLGQSVLACLLTWFASAPSHRIDQLEDRVSKLLRSNYARASRLVALNVEPTQRAVLLVLVFGTFAVITFSHQLSPYMIIAAAALLTALGAMRPGWIVGVLALIAGSYLLLRLDFLRAHEGLLLSFNLFRNVENSDATPDQGVLGRVITGYAARGLSATIWLLALIGAIRRNRAGASVFAPLVLMLAPVLILFGQQYGGEAIYRVFLFSLPWAACLAAFALAPTALWTWWSTARVGVTLGVMTLLFLQAYFGLADINQVRPTELAASDYFYAHARFGSVLVLAAPNYPERGSAVYDHFVVTAGAFDPQLVPNREFLHRTLGADDLPAIEAIAKSYAPHGYLAITSGMKIYAHVFKLLPDGSLDNLDRALSASQHWRVFFRNKDAVIYELVDQPPTRPPL